MRLSSCRLWLFALGILLADGQAQEKTNSNKRGTAFAAVRLLNAQQQAALAVIAGRDGSLDPERWHLLVHEAGSETGVREFVVTGGKVATSRTVSQFAEKLAPESVFAPESLKLDSDQVIRIARDFARANRVTLARVHFDLRRSASDGLPLWTAICLDAQGQELGRLVLNASDSGTVVSHAGFAVVARSEQKTNASAEPAERRPKRKSGTPNTSRRRNSPPPFATAPPPPAPQPQPPPRAGFFDRVFGSGR